MIKMAGSGGSKSLGLKIPSYALQLTYFFSAVLMYLAALPYSKGSINKAILSVVFIIPRENILLFLAYTS